MKKMGDAVGVADLKLGDVVSMNDGTYMQCTVTAVPVNGEGRLVMHRPYLMIDDFSHSGKYGGSAVGFGIWAEEIVFGHDSSVTFTLMYTGRKVR
jgi:hypothetical protein